MSDKITFAVVGYGHIGKRHAEMIMRNTESELIAVVDKKGELAEDVSFPFFTSLEALRTSDLNPDVVCICTPNGLHTPQALEALQEGYNVVIEKPMALNKTGCELVINKATEKDKNVFCVMQNRYSPPAQWIKSVIDDNLLGEIFMVNINCYWNRDERYYSKDHWHGTADMDGGTIYTQFSHFIDMMYWLFGDITNIEARFADFTHQGVTEFEDSGIVKFDFTKGGMGSFSYSTAVYDKNFESSMTIIGKNGTVKIGGQYMDKVEYCHIKGYEMPTLPPTNDANNYGPYKGSAANHHFIIENVVDTLKGRSQATTNANEGMMVVDIIERIYNLK